MNKKDRLLDVFERLRYEKVLSTKKEFAERIGFDKTNLSSAFGGSEKYLTDNLFNKIADAFPQFDRVWLLTGEGEMLKNSIQDISTDRQEVTLVLFSLFLHKAAGSMILWYQSERKIAKS